MKKLWQVLLAGLLCSCCSDVFAQQAPASPGSVKGVLRDTVHNYPVKSATVSLYRADSTLINYQLSNNYGEFTFRNLPLNNKFYIEVSHISYQRLRNAFEVTTAAPAADLKTLIVPPRVVTLDEISVSIPPIVMNGDTLEFNPSAFKLDSNAVVEDLLRKIPNVTLWGDGLITVNGREVKSLLVNGKEFFGNDFKIATQNISKNALEKVQVYNVQKDKQNLLDSTLTVNLKLKKGKDVGHFGKIGGGYGTDGRFEGDANLNFFSPRMTLGFVGAMNNINKISNSASALLSSGTFKGPGTNVEYQPDFRVSGISRTSAGGASYTYNFIEKPEYDKRKTLKANYFIQDRHNNNDANSLTTTTVGNGKKIIDRNSSDNTAISTNQSFDSGFELGSQKEHLNITQNASFNTGQSENRSLRSAADELGVLTSTNNSLGRSDYTNKSFRLNLDYDHNNYNNYKQKIRNYQVQYNLNVTDNNSERTDITNFRAIASPSTNRDFNRRYVSNSNAMYHTLSMSLPEINRLVFGLKRPGNIQIGISNELTLNHSEDNNSVADLNTATQLYTNNAYLTNKLTTNLLRDAPTLTLRRSFSKYLSNRFNRTYSVDLMLKQQFNLQDNRSAKAFQNISRNYSNFTPGLRLGYYRYQYGEYSNQLNLNLTTDVRIPTINQLAPLTDSTNLYRIQRGNLALKESHVRMLSLSFYHNDQRGKNTFNYSGNMSASFTSQAIADSILIDPQNRRAYFPVNADGARTVNGSFTMRKSLKLKTGALQLNLNGSASLSRNPGYLNGTFNYSNNLDRNGDFGLNYTYKSKFAAETKQSVSMYRSRQDAFNTNYSGTNLATTFSGSYNATKKITLNSNINFNTNRSAGVKPIDYTIWNANAVFRFLKNSNAELKLSALDLLHQNQSVLNSGGQNSFTISTRNTLQQYFMTTISYYPRKFGK